MATKIGLALDDGDAGDDLDYADSQFMQQRTLLPRRPLGALSVTCIARGSRKQSRLLFSSLNQNDYKYIKQINIKYKNLKYENIKLYPSGLGGLKDVMH